MIEKINPFLAGSALIRKARTVGEDTRVNIEKTWKQKRVIARDRERRRIESAAHANHANLEYKDIGRKACYLKLKEPYDPDWVDEG